MVIFLKMLISLSIFNSMVRNKHVLIIDNKTGIKKWIPIVLS